MKVTHSQPPQFAPVTVHIVCESQEELDALACIFNCAPLGDAASDTFKGVLLPYEELQDAGGKTDRFAPFLDSLKKCIGKLR
jgi:hypothetical protein